MSLSPPLTGTAGSLPLPNTAPTPAGGEFVLAEQIQEGVQVLLNQDATLAACMLPLTGGTITGDLEVSDDLVVGDLLTASGFMRITGTQPASTVDPTPHAVYSTNQCKSWCVISVNAGTVVVFDGYNVSSVVVSGVGLRVSFARAFATVDYAPFATTRSNGSALAPYILGFDDAVGQQTTGYCTLYAYDVDGTPIDLGVVVARISVHVMGRQ